MPASDILRNFESIGDGCEFGFVQDHFGLRPISLLRWAGCSLDGLVAGLEANFADLFRDEDVRPAGVGMICDRKYSIYYHSKLRFAGETLSAAPDNLEAFRRLQRDIRFRLRLFNETLAERSRIYVYKTTHDLNVRDILRLKSALDLRGPQKLLCVQGATAERPSGRMETLACGLKLVGFAGLAAPEAQDRVDGPGWLRICAEAAIADWGHGHAAGAVVGAGAGDGGRSGMPHEGLAAELITALYRTLLLRDPSAVELAASVEGAARHRRTMEEMIAQVLLSAEFAAGREAFLANYSIAGWTRLMARVLGPAAVAG